MKPNNVKITKEEFFKNIAYYVERAHQEPIYITKNGRPDLVLVSCKKLEQMKSSEKN